MEENQGIMSLPMGNEPMPVPAQDTQMFTPEQASGIEFARSQTAPSEVSNEAFRALEQVDPALVLEIRQDLAGAQLPPEIVEVLKRMVDTILANPSGYQELRAEILSDPEVADILGDLLPPTFDISFFASFRVVLDQLLSSPGTEMTEGMSGIGGLPGMGGMPVQGFAQGGIAELKPIAQALSQMGRNGDTMLAHITPQEAMMLRRMGGSGTINPYTGLPEYFLKSIGKAISGVFKSVGKAVTGVVKGIGKAVKKIASSPIGKIALSIAAVYFMGPAGFNLATKLSITNAALAAGVNTFAGSTLVNLASGMKPSDSLKDGLRNGLLAGVGVGVTQGFDAVAPTGVPTQAPIEDAVARARAAAAAEAAVAPGLPVSVGASPEAVLTPPGVSAITPPAVASPIQYVDTNLGLTTPIEVLQAPVTQFTDAELRNVLSGTQNIGAGGIQVAGAPPAVLDATNTSTPSIYDRATGALSRGYQGAKDVYSDFISPNRGMPTPAQIDVRVDELIAKAKTKGSSLDYKDAVALATKELTPSLISQYAPMAALSLGAASLGGAFTPEEPPEPSLIRGPTGIDLYRADPGKYAPNIVAGQTPVSYQELNPNLYRQEQYAMYDPFSFQPRSQYRRQQPVMRAEGGITETSKFKRKMGPINGPGTGTSDDIPAMLSDGEFVFTARAVRGMGNGSRRKGAKEMYRLMKMLEKKVGGKS